MNEQNPPPDPLVPNNRIPPDLLIGMGEDTGLRITVESHDRKVHLAFNKPVMCLILAPRHARQIAIHLLMQSEQILSTPKPQPPLT